LTHIAQSEPRNSPEGVKRAFHGLQCAAGCFQFINDNFLHAPSSDLHRDVVAFLVELCLAQAQECFWEKTVEEKGQEKPTLCAKVASWLAATYESLAEKFEAFDAADADVAKVSDSQGDWGKILLVDDVFLVLGYHNVSLQFFRSRENTMEPWLIFTNLRLARRKENMEKLWLEWISHTPWLKRVKSLPNHYYLSWVDYLLMKQYHQRHQQP
jgi:hypothetical protein